MTSKLATFVFVAGTLVLAPAAGYAADAQDTPSGTSSKTETMKESVSDTAITTKIKADFAVDKQVSALKIHVDTDKGVVKLTGNAKTQAEADKAVSIAKNTKGVVSVTNDIKVGTY